MTNRHQSGFASVLIIVVVGLSIAVGTATYRAWANSKSFKQSVETATTTNTSTRSIIPPPPPANTPPPPATTPVPPPPPPPLTTTTISAPYDLAVTPFGGGYRLTWKPPSAGVLAKYQVFYQNNKIAEPVAATYTHQLPPPPPSCNPISLTYYVRAVSSTGTVSHPSSSVTVQFGGC